VVGTFLAFRVPVDFRDYGMLLVLGLAYLFFMRVIDDFNDRDHDAKYYPERSIQRGDLNLRKLLWIAGIVMAIVVVGFGYAYGYAPALLILAAVGVTYASIVGF
jgi:4-hydroxybenzoate polyprenyltransferase